jgi:uncharacterized protein (DUF2336 family)
MLTQDDIELVRRARLGAAVVPTAEKLAVVYSSSVDDNRRKIAEDIIAIWLEGATIEVRKTLAHQLCHCPFLPRELALQMARDLESVAVPMLRFSEVYADEDLLTVIETAEPSKHIAVAMRRDVPYALAEALIATEDEEVVAALVENDGAALPEGLLHRIIDVFLDSATIQEGLAHRADLPLSIGERLIALVSNQLRQHLVTRFELPEALADELASASREAATSAMIPSRANEEIARLFVGHLQRAGRLTPTFLLRALCDGNVSVFGAGLACHSGIPMEHIERALRSTNAAGLSECLVAAGIPNLLIPAVRAAVDVIVNGRPASQPQDISQDQVSNFINRIVQQYDFIDPGDLDAVLIRLFQAARGDVSNQMYSAPEPAGDLARPSDRPCGPQAKQSSASPLPGLFKPKKAQPTFGRGNELIVSPRKRRAGK